MLISQGPRGQILDHTWLGKRLQPNVFGTCSLFHKYCRVPAWSIYEIIHFRMPQRCAVLTTLNSETLFLPATGLRRFFFILFFLFFKKRYFKMARNELKTRFLSLCAA